MLNMCHDYMSIPSYFYGISWGSNYERIGVQKNLVVAPPPSGLVSIPSHSVIRSDDVDEPLQLKVDTR